MSQQSQPVIPVTMQYGSGGYGSGYGHHLANEIHRTSDHLRGDVQRTAEHTQNGVNQSKDYLGTQASTHTNWVRGDISNSKDKITQGITDGTAVVRSDLANDTANIIASVNAQAYADQTQTRASETETRQAVERNADQILADSNRNSDYVNNVIQATSVAGVLATNNASTLGLSATHQTGIATALAVQNTTSDLKSVITDTRRDLTSLLAQNFSALSVQSERNSSMISQQVLTQAQAILLGQKDAEVNASNNRAALQLQSADYKAALSLQSSENTKDIQLQAANYKAYLENHITKTASDGVLKTVESASKLLEEIKNCCCENRLAHSATQSIVMQNGNNNQAAIQQGQMNQLQQALATAQNESLMARITNSVISTSTNVGSGSSTVKS